MPSVYIESTIPSFYHETRKDPQVIAWREATRLWWDRYRAIYDLYTSRFVVREVETAPRGKAAKSLKMLGDAQILSEPTELSEVIRYYIEQHVMPDDALGDAAHLAMASLHGIDFLLTWNCRHLANANKVRHVTVVNNRLGLSTPTITTPFSLIPEFD